MGHSKLIRPDHVPKHLVNYLLKPTSNYKTVSYKVDIRKNLKKVDVCVLGYYPTLIRVKTTLSV
jgi:hypothetical protein